MDVVYKHFSTITSTNSWAMENAGNLASDRVTIVSADEQSTGHGRSGRQWLSPAGGNLYITYCFFLENDFLNIGQLLALSCAKALETLGFSPTFKWPNDLLLGEKKVSGVLCETKELQGMRFVAAGIGLNVNMSREQLKKISAPATSLAIEAGKWLNLAEVKQQLDSHFLKDLALYQCEGFAPFFKELKQRIPLGAQVKFHDGSKALSARIDTVHSDGSLTLQFADGIKKRCHSGEFMMSDRAFQNPSPG